MKLIRFNISKSLSLPRESITWVNSIIAKRGAGKTYSGAVLAEEMLKNNVPIIVIDGMGIWWGLRVGKNGQGDGLPIVVFGGEHADIPLDPMKAKQIAKAIVETNICAVLDLSAFSKTISRKIVAEFLDELYKINRLERHVFVEEADLWAPQRVIGIEQIQCLGAMDNFVRRGGNKNLGCSLITQRSAVLNKDLLTQSDCLIILRTLAPQDKKAIQAWVEEQTDEDRKKLNVWYDSLKSLKNGEAYVWHPEKQKIFQKIMFRKRETFHATRTFLLSPKATRIKLMDVNEFVTKFKDKFEPKSKEVPKPIIPKVEPKKFTCVDCGTKFVPKVVNETITIPLDTKKGLTTEQEYMKQAELFSGEVVQPYPYKDNDKEIIVRKSEPTIILEKLKTTINILSEPITPLGKIVVILKNMLGNRNDKWTQKAVLTKVQEHGWETSGIEEEFKRLVQWEILIKQSNNYYRFDTRRVNVIEREVEINSE